jgi:hypothetical protein
VASLLLDPQTLRYRRKRSMVQRVKILSIVAGGLVNRDHQGHSVVPTGTNRPAQYHMKRAAVTCQLSHFNNIG